MPVGKAFPENPCTSVLGSVNNATLANLIQQDISIPCLIREDICRVFKVGEDELLSKKRDGYISLARQTTMYLIRQITDATLYETGNELGGRTPATVSHAYIKISKEMCNNHKFAKVVNDIQKRISSKINVICEVGMVEKIDIKDEEWERFLEEEYRQVAFNLPDKKVTEKFLNWRKKKDDEKMP